ncbi:hypothetical protein LGM58_35940 [Burkholderia contaminans]|uniref:hypothetical protein n=1 Tax=Burkholderia contaminans TaxID=488447 RepID=UPI001CF52012|nr:hypothetical protein [Burkholderia contaminans]MCA7888577.1 hypothetical protein [Burkholderia contaminans]
MSKLNALASGISAVSLGVTSITQASTHPFSPVAIGAMLGAIGAAVFAGYCLTSGEHVRAGQQNPKPKN